jgi:hypothetical protein
MLEALGKASVASATLEAGALPVTHANDPTTPDAANLAGRVAALQITVFNSLLRERRRGF